MIEKSLVNGAPISCWFYFDEISQFRIVIVGYWKLQSFLVSECRVTGLGKSSSSLLNQAKNMKAIISIYEAEHSQWPHCGHFDIWLFRQNLAENDRRRSKKSIRSNLEPTFMEYKQQLIKLQILQLYLYNELYGLFCCSLLQTALLLWSGG